VTRAAEPQTVTIKGSDTLIVLVQRWAEDFMVNEPNIRIQITGGGSGTGIAALLNGTTDVALASRGIRSEETAQLLARTGLPPAAWAVARDGVTFYVHAGNPVEVLSLGQLKSLYVGELHRWSEVGGPDHAVALYSRESSSGTYAFVKERVLHQEDFATQVQTLPGTAAVVRAVAEEPWGVGYGGVAFANGVKELKLQLPSGEVVAPTEENVLSGRYPLSRVLYLYTRGAPRQAVRAFIDFVLSPRAQQAVRALGYFPFTQPSRSPGVNPWPGAAQGR
jgi:phosphate transport system substrate-binding protein